MPFKVKIYYLLKVSAVQISVELQIMEVISTIVNQLFAQYIL